MYVRSACSGGFAGSHCSIGRGSKFVVYGKRFETLRAVNTSKTPQVELRSDQCGSCTRARQLGSSGRGRMRVTAMLALAARARLVAGPLEDLRVAGDEHASHLLRMENVQVTEDV